ncbi:50S ribosomal protein L22 [Acetivibrio mesophilus]|uniref:Large ribosomal subunit protein uL22 n=1 Tax=Acetivibrio mesophilus TaxID=2487273 RepID=A0A4Q0I1X4_9FIRM|nr:50S ribosomal protein L22 [Acetivibrio mesophilus]RXE58234.1 50S ribosomal protein L22 [Acetivibrio mesophilus]HHV28253.1 50S ribosomal protein L22 [Clostridium sp.]
MAQDAKVKQDNLEENQKAIEAYNAKHRRSKKPALLTKSERKKLGIGKDQGKAVVRYARISSRKVKIVLDLIKGKGIDEAYGILRYTPKASSDILYKLLKSAESNATNNNGLDRDNLYVAEAFANQGPTLKRIMPRAKGSADRIRKRTSHITLVVKERS